MQEVILFTAEQQVAVTHVTKTLSATYNVKTTITKTLSSSYNVKQSITKTLTSNYNVIKSITKTLTATYNVIQRITKTLSPAYTVRTFPLFITGPVVSGNPLSGQTLTESGDTWGGLPTPTVTHQWQVETAPGSNVFIDIPGETATTLVI